MAQLCYVIFNSYSNHFLKNKILISKLIVTAINITLILSKSFIPSFKFTIFKPSIVLLYRVLVPCIVMFRLLKDGTLSHQIYWLLSLSMVLAVNSSAPPPQFPSMSLLPGVQQVAAACCECSRREAQTQLADMTSLSMWLCHMLKRQILFYLCHSGCTLIYGYITQQLQLHRYQTASLAGAGCSGYSLVGILFLQVLVLWLPLEVALTKSLSFCF